MHSTVAGRELGWEKGAIFSVRILSFVCGPHPETVSYGWGRVLGASWEEEVLPWWEEALSQGPLLNTVAGNPHYAYQ